MHLAIEPLTRDAFAPFGEVIEAAADHLSFPINAGTSQRSHDLARLDPGEGGRLIVSTSAPSRGACRSPSPCSNATRRPRKPSCRWPGDRFLSSSRRKANRSTPHRFALSSRRENRASTSRRVSGTTCCWPCMARATSRVIDRDDAAGNCDERSLDRTLLLHIEPDVTGEAA